MKIESFCIVAHYEDLGTFYTTNLSARRGVKCRDIYFDSVQTPFGQIDGVMCEQIVGNLVDPERITLSFVPLDKVESFVFKKS